MPESYSRDKYPERSLRDFYYILFRHKWKAFIFFLVVVITVTLGTLLATEIYRSDAKLLVRLGRESVSLDPTATTGQVISVGQSREGEINSELEILKSRELAEKVVKAIGPDVFMNNNNHKGSNAASSAGDNQDWLSALKRKLRPVKKDLENILDNLGLVSRLTDQERVVNAVSKNLTIEGQKNSNILSISYEAQSPKLAQTVINRLIDFFLDKHITTHRTPGSYEFFEKQAEDLRKRLAQTEEDLRKLKNKTGVASLEEQRKTLLDRINTLQKDSEANQTALSASKARMESLDRQIATVSQTLVTQTQDSIGNNTYGMDMMRTKLYDLRLKEQDLLSRYTENSVPVQEIRRQIAEGQAILAKEEPTRAQQVTKGINVTRQQLDFSFATEKANLSSLQSKVLVFKNQLEVARRELIDLNNTEFQIGSLQRELSLQEAKYRKHIENLEQARIDQALETTKISNISIVQAATLSTEPVRPRKGLNILLGLLLGAFGAVGLAFFSEFLDHSIKTPQDIEEKLQLPMLASIPKLRK